MTLSLYETIQRIVQQELQQIRTADLAVVQEQHPHADESDHDNYACTVQMRNSGLVLKQVPVATPRIGYASIPAVGELVLVQFVGGDVNAPVITGRLYNDEDRPPVNDDAQAILHLPLGADDSEAVHVELHSGEERELVFKLGEAIEVYVRDGDTQELIFKINDAFELQIRDDDPVVTLDVDGGKATVQIDRDGAVTIESQGTMTLKGNEINIEAQTTLNLKGQSQVNVEGGVINLN